MTLSLGAYQLLASLGQGGMCDVLLAVKDAQGVDFTKLVVIKKLRQEHTNDVEFVQMFLDEARIAARLNHPNVIQTLDVGQEGEDFFIAMEYLDGQPFNRIVAQSKKMPLAMRLAVLSDVLSGMHYAHELRDYDGTPLQIVHRDVTPHNVFVTYDGQVKVMDFGIAKATGRATQTRHGVIKGKINYMAPEQVVATQRVDRRVDVFTVGIMLYEAAAGARMWSGAPSATILKTLVKGEHPTSPRTVNASVHPELDRICQNALARIPADRYGTAEAFREDLDAYITEHEKRPSNRQIGVFVAEVFREQRERARAILEKQLAAVLDERRSLIALSMGSGDVSEPEIEIDTESASGHVVPTETRRPTAIEPAPHAASRQKVAGGRRIVALASIAIVSLALAGFGLLRFVGSSSSSRAQASQAAPENATITLTLRATPLETTFRLDDGPPLDNPYIIRLPADHKSHNVRATAPGYSDDVEHVVFDHDISIRIALVHGTAKE